MDFRQLAKHDINIKHTVNNGIIVRVGCAELAFTSPKDMLLKLADFYADPEKAEKEFIEFSQFPQEVESAGPDPGRGNTLAQPMGRGPTVTSREPTLSVHGPDNETTDEEEAPSLVNPHHNFNLAEESPEEDMEEIVELNLGDLESILEEDMNDDLPEIDFDLDDDKSDQKR